MIPKEITLNANDLKCLMRGGSIDYEIKDGDEVKAVITLSIERESKGFRQPANAER